MSPTPPSPVTDPPVHTAALAVVGVVALGFLLWWTRSFTIPLATAGMFAVLLAPALDRLESWRIPAPAALLLVVVALVGAMVGVGALMNEAARSVMSALPRYAVRAERLANDSLARIEQATGVELEGIDTQLQERFAALLSSETSLATLNQGLGSFVSLVSSILLMGLFLAFFLAGREAFLRKIYRVLELGGRTDAQALVRSVSRRVQGYLVWKTAVSVVTGLVFGLTALAFGLDFPIVWGFFSFVFNYIPSIGPLLAVVPPVLLAFFQFDSATYAMAAGLSLLTVNFVSGNVIEPMVMGRRLDLNVVVVLVSLFAWGSIWGFVGMLLAVPLTSILNILLSHSVRYRPLSVLLSAADEDD